jgi:two-component system, OmpR family, response regulator VicR
VKARILIVDDDPFILESLGKYLAGNDFAVVGKNSAESAFAEIAESAPDLAILDVSLPGADGISLCRRIRAKWNFPILMLTAKSSSIDKVVGLEVGADDYLTKPFEPEELLARVRSLLRRASEYSSKAEKATTIEIGQLMIDLGAKSVHLGGRSVSLTKREFELLAHLARNEGRVLSRETLFLKCWGYDINFNSNSLDVMLYRLRTKIERNPSNPEYLHTHKGMGYKMLYIAAE